ncbi:MAG: P-loop NTPase [Octadecabacter sp.]|nr:P-loop NTPase [Octadecabacter sp.]
MESQLPCQSTTLTTSLDKVWDHLLDNSSSSLQSLSIVSASGEGVVFAAEFNPISSAEMLSIEGKIKASALDLEGVDKVSVVSTTSAPLAPKPVSPAPKMIAVGSGKGGVGKSTLSVNLALALARTGIRVGILDADIYGPSVPKMLGIEGSKTEYEDSKLKPIVKSGVQAMSMGLMVDPEQAVMWRGPMLIQALKKMINETHWGDTQIIIIDLPPGTGDVQMSLAKNSGLYGSVVVSTPQDVALPRLLAG